MPVLVEIVPPVAITVRRAMVGSSRTHVIGIRMWVPVQS
ncbi:hypothetical protein MPS_0336 [Mycobacterium pseudoshottsii JCM 15466]|nr:hypothetical protein MPS_0336 [Mycobacterium pseudoshottsii JCM 15466]